MKHFTISLSLGVALSCLSSLGVLAAGCGSGPFAGESVSSESEDLFGLGSLAQTWPGGNVPVCFQNTADHPELQALIPGILKQSWTAAAHLSFTGFGNCSSAGNQVTLVFAAATNGFCPSNSTCTGGYKCVSGVCDSYRGNTNSLGAGRPTVTLISDDTSPGQPQFRYQVVHEFGHALGFAHEMQRPDNWIGTAWKQCGVAPTNSDYQNYKALPGGVNLTSQYDPNSIMNYCEPNGAQLSVGDILGARSAYGPSACDFGGSTACTPTANSRLAMTFSIPSQCPATQGWVMKTATGTPLPAGPNPNQWVIGYQFNGALESGPAIGSTQQYLMCDAFNNCSAPFSLTMAYCNPPKNQICVPLSPAILCTPPSINAAGPAACGTRDADCGVSIDCGACASGTACSDGYCCARGTHFDPQSGTCAACTPNPTALCSFAECGTVTDDCGDVVSCGSCGAGLTCSNNVCQCNTRKCGSGLHWDPSTCSCIKGLPM